jgi:hypothetical protein
VVLRGSLQSILFCIVPGAMASRLVSVTLSNDGLVRCPINCTWIYFTASDEEGLLPCPVPSKVLCHGLCTTLGILRMSFFFLFTTTRGAQTSTERVNLLLQCGGIRSILDHNDLDAPLTLI